MRQITSKCRIPSLPESQLDRFMICLSIGYPSLENQMRIINAQRYSNPLSDVRPVTNAHETSADRYGLPGKKRKQSSVSAVALPARGPAYGGRAHSAHGYLEC